VWWPGLLIWLAAAIAASLLGWSTRIRALVTLGALVLAVLVVAARQVARYQSGGSRPQVPPGRPGRCPWAQQSGPAGASPSPPSPSPSPHPSPPSPPSPNPPSPRPARSRRKVEQLGDRLGRGIAIVLLMAVVAVPVAWWLIARS
jgi:hypothetical protein